MILSLVITLIGLLVSVIKLEDLLLNIWTFDKAGTKSCQKRSSICKSPMTFAKISAKEIGVCLCSAT